jgi:hypothetical protein
LKLTGTPEFAVVWVNGMAIFLLINPILLHFLGDGGGILANELGGILKGHLLVQALLDVDPVLKCQMALVSSNFFRHDNSFPMQAGNQPLLYRNFLKY